MCVYGVVDQGDEGRVTRLTRHRAGYTACADGERRPTTPPSRRKEEEKKPKAHERQKKSENPPTTPRVALLWPSLGGYPSMFFAAGQANTTQRAVCAFHSSKRRKFPFLPFLFYFFSGSAPVPKESKLDTNSRPHLEFKLAARPSGQWKGSSALCCGQTPDHTRQLLERDFGARASVLLC